MRRFLLGSTLFLVLLGSCFLTFALGTAWAHPFDPGDTLFRVQVNLERAYARQLQDPGARARYALQILEHRAQAAIERPGPETWAALDVALSDAALSLAQLPEAIWPLYAGEMNTTLAAAEGALQNYLNQNPNDPLARRLLLKVQTARDLVQKPDTEPMLLARVAGMVIAEDAGASAQDLAVVNVDALRADGTTGKTIQPTGNLRAARHEFYPLIGKHATLDCAACHQNNRFVGTPDTCEGCHLQDKPANHFTGPCASCHSPMGWDLATFDHAQFGATDCLSCHAKDKPANHFEGQCSNCHSTTAWRPASFDHALAGATDCIACHAKDKPANHFDGQCSACHSTTAWRPASFDHALAGATDCIACHAKDKPANHFDGQCSACHSTTAWRPASFDHALAGATDCIACHAKDKPANHFDGQCSACHSTTAWRPASFDHALAGATDCIACHAKDKPANHFDGQCSNCHSTTSWAGASFAHPFPLNHGGANGECIACHTSATGGPVVCENCHDPTKMANEHAEEGIFNIAGRCVECHADGTEDGGYRDDARDDDDDRDDEDHDREGTTTPEPPDDDEDDDDEDERDEDDD